MKKWEARSFFIILGLMFIGLLLRVKSIPENGMWFDEMYSLWVSFQPFPKGILETLYNYDAHAPLYHFILHFFIKIFGTNDFTLQFFNILISLSAIPIVYLLGKEISDGNKEIGYLSAFFMTINAFHITFSSDVRFFNLSGIWLTLSTLFLFKFIKKPSKQNVLLTALFNVLLCYTLTQGCMYVFIQALVFGVYLLIKNKSKLKQFILSYIITFIFYIPYLPFIYHQNWNIHNAFLGSYSWNKFEILYFFQTFTSVLKPLLNFYEDIYTYTQFKDPTILFTFFTSFILFWYFVVSAFRQKMSFFKLLLYFVTALLSFHCLLHLSHLPVVRRYFIPFIPLFCPLLANIFTTFNKYAKIFIIVFYIETLIFGIIANSSYKENARYAPLVNLLKQQNPTAQDLIFQAGSGSAKFYAPKGIKAQTFDICFNAYFLFRNEEKIKILLGKNSSDFNTEEEKENYLIDFASNINISNSSRKYYNEKISNLKRGSIVIGMFSDGIWNKDDTQKAFETNMITEETYKKIYRKACKEIGYYGILAEKIERDYYTLMITDKRLTLIRTEFPNTLCIVMYFVKTE